MAALSFQARIFKMSTWFFIEVPYDIKAQWGKGTHRAKGTIDQTPISGLMVRLYKDDTGRQSYILALQADTRASLGKGEGDEVSVRLEPDNGELELPADLAEAIQADAAVQAAWEKLTNGRKIALVKHVESAKQAETRKARIAKAVEDLRAGKAMY